MKEKNILKERKEREERYCEGEEKERAGEREGGGEPREKVEGPKREG